MILVSECLAFVSSPYLLLMCALIQGCQTPELAPTGQIQTMDPLVG